MKNIRTGNSLSKSSVFNDVFRSLSNVVSVKSVFGKLCLDDRPSPRNKTAFSNLFGVAWSSEKLFN